MLTLFDKQITLRMGQALPEKGGRRGKGDAAAVAVVSGSHPSPRPPC